MPRSKNTADVETVDETEETNVQVDGQENAEEKAPKKKAEPKRGDLPEGYVTPIGLAKVLTERGLHQNRAGETVEVRPQMVYSYIKNAPKDDAFPLETVTDSIGKERQAVKTEDGVAWWERKNSRVEARKANAKEKADKKAARAAEKAQAAEAEGEASEETAPTEEAE
jgi:predicted transcriptional regulator